MLPATLVAMGNCCEPVATVVLSYAVEGTALTPAHGAGCLAVMAGMGVYLGVCGGGSGSDGGGSDGAEAADESGGGSPQTTRAASSKISSRKGAEGRGGRSAVIQHARKWGKSRMNQF